MKYAMPTTLRRCGLHERQTAYSGGSMEAFMRLVESGQGITFIPQLTVEQLSPSQKELVRPFGMPRPVREVRLVVRQDYSRRKLRPGSLRGDQPARASGADRRRRPLRACVHSV